MAPHSIIQLLGEADPTLGPAWPEAGPSSVHTP